MKLVFAAILLVVGAFGATPSDMSGIWHLDFSGAPETGPKTVGAIVLALNVDGDAVTGTAQIGAWPGDAPIANGHVEGDRITFTATGHRGSTTGIPTCQFEVTLNGDEMVAVMKAIKNAGGPLGPDIPYRYVGKKKLP